MKEDDWIADGDRITDAHVLAQLKVLLEERSDVIVEHRHYRGARAPDRFIATSLEQLTDYFQAEAKPGDSFWIWSFDDSCPGERAAFHGKIPDGAGRVPRQGAY